MSKSVAVAVIHGIGSQGSKAPEDSAKPDFSKRLHKAVRRQFGSAKFDADIAWREIFYSDITQQHQAEYLARIKRKTRGAFFRDFFVNNLGDAATYRFIPGEQTGIYRRVHERVRLTLAQLEKDTSRDAPLLILAHSLGGHVMSNYIYDQQKGTQYDTVPELCNCNTVSNVITFGCNIPLFTFAWGFDDVSSIQYPGVALDDKFKQKTWWDNYYDKDDVLGFPLAETGAGYKELHDKKELRDHNINAGGIFRSWNGFSHTQYWSDSDIVTAVTKKIDKVLEISRK